LCSGAELGLEDDESGIIVLDADDATPLGASAQVAVGIDDYLMEIKAPANRGDILSHLGMARELVSIVGGAVVWPTTDVASAELLNLDGKVQVSVTVSDPRCHRYVARRVSGLKVAPSPRRFAQRLRNVGVRPINNLVDVTNYVMFEIGQPLHAFDAALIGGAHLDVRAAGGASKLPYTQMTTLDDVTRSLLPDDLLICDSSKPLALAGVMGGKDCEVTNTTTDVLLESASFDAIAVRRTSRRCGLHSESSHRFERNVDPAYCAMAAARAAYLMATMGGGTIAAEVVDNYPTPRVMPAVVLRHVRIAQIVGAPIAPAVSQQLLQQLGCSVVVAGDAMSVTPPTHRFDLTREIDLIEEILRLRGYDEVPDRVPGLRQLPGVTMVDKSELVRAAMVAAGLNEAITFGFTSAARIKALGLPADDVRCAPIALRNPMSLEHAVMRTHLLPNLLAALARNLSFGHKDVALFEVGSVFLAKPRDATAGRDAGLADERSVLCGVLMGQRPSQLAATTAWDVFDAKGLAQRAVESVANRPIDTRGPSNMPYVHPGVGADILLSGNQVIGCVGEVHPDVRSAFGISVPVFMFELWLDKLMVASPRQMHAIGKYPGTSRDVSLLVAENVPSNRAAQVVAQAGQAIVSGIRVLEVFRDDKLPAGTKSVLYSIAYRALDRTLTDAEVESTHIGLVAKLVAELGASQR
jgi:phenylalanyl-tRNA synthetase beta chain